MKSKLMNSGKAFLILFLVLFLSGALQANAKQPLAVGAPDEDDEPSVAALGSQSAFSSGLPPVITGEPVIDSPLNFLAWPQDTPGTVPDLTEPTANRLNDLHGKFASCDFVLSTAGNYHMAMRELWYDIFLPDYASDLGLKNIFYTTSPPITSNQIKNNSVVFGNVQLACRPQVAVAPLAEIKQLQAAGYTTGSPQLVLHNRGNVLLVKKGNPKHIRSIWDLRRPDVSVVTPNPLTEKSTFDNYSQTIYYVALNDEQSAPGGWNADRLFSAIFNNLTTEPDDYGQGVPRVGNKWFAGTKIHHREVPWSIAYGHADAGVLFYHLALHAVQNFPDLFEIVPLGGTADDPRPLPGNRIGVHYGIPIKGNWTPLQQTAVERFFEALASDAFTQTLVKDGLTR